MRSSARSRESGRSQVASAKRSTRPAGAPRTLPLPPALTGVSVAVERAPEPHPQRGSRRWRRGPMRDPPSRQCKRRSSSPPRRNRRGGPFRPTLVRRREQACHPEAQLGAPSSSEAGLSAGPLVTLATTQAQKPARRSPTATVATTGASPRWARTVLGQPERGRLTTRDASRAAPGACRAIRTMIRSVGRSRSLLVEAKGAS